MQAATTPEEVNVSSALTETQQFPVASLEVINTEGLLALGASQEQVNQVVSTILQKMKAQLEKYQAKVLYQRDNVLFFTVAASGQRVEQLMDKTLRLAIAIVDKSIPIKGVELTIRAGVDLCAASTDEEMQLASVPERHGAKSKELVVSQRIYQYCQFQLPFEVIGPIDVMGQPLTFYKLLYKEIKSKVQNPPSAPVQQQAELPPAENYAVSTPQVADETSASEQPEYTPALNASAISKLAAASAESIQTSPQPVTASLSTNQFLFDFTELEPLTLVDLGLPEKQSLPEVTLPLLYGPALVERHQNVPYAQIPIQLTQLLGNWVADPQRKGQTLLLNLESTCGKTTVLNLVRQQLPQEKMIWISGQFYSANQQAQVPFSFWVEVLFNIVGLPLEGVSRETAQAQLGQAIQGLFGDFLSPEELKLLHQVIVPERDLSSRRFNNDAISALFYTILSHFSFNNPIIFLIEDIELADNASLELLARLVERGILNYPIALILTSANGYGPLDHLKVGLENYPQTHINIEQPQENDLKAIFEAPMGVPLQKLPAHLIKQVTSTGQSPMYVEEALRYLVSQGALEFRKKDNKFLPTKNKISSVSIPYSIQEMIIERARRLEDTTRQILHFACVLGQRFSIQLLAAVVQNPEALENSLKILWEEGFIVPESQIQSQFRHRIIWETLYNTISKDQREAYHSQIFSLLQQAEASGQLMPHPVVYYYHAYYSGKALFTQATLENGLIPFLATIGDTQTINYLLCQQMQQLALQPQGDLTTTALKIAELNDKINPELVVKALSQIIHQPATQLDAPQLVNILLQLAESYRLNSQLLEARQLLTHLIVAQDRLLSVSQRKQAVQALMQILSEQGQYRLVLWLMDEYLVEDNQLRLADKLHSVLPLTKLAVVEALIYRTHPETQQLLIQLLDEVQEAPEVACRARILALSYALSQGENIDTQEQFERILDEIERIGAPDDLVGMWGVNRLRELILKNDMDAGLAMYDSILESLQKTPYVLQEGIARNMLSQLLLQNGLFDECLGNIQNTIEFAIAYELNVILAGALALKASVFLRTEQVEEAEKAIEEAFRLIAHKDVDSRLDQFTLYAFKAEVLLHKQQAAEARELLEPIWSQISPLRLLPSMLLIAQLLVIVYDQLAQQAEYDKKHPFEKLKNQFEQKILTLQHELNYKADAFVA